jgi:predicted ThiF/HesA family dinucleotide-utilizing enzyme
VRARFWGKEEGDTPLTRVWDEETSERGSVEVLACCRLGLGIALDFLGSGRWRGD